MTDWPHIVEQYGPLVWRTAYRLLNQDADAADCFQRTFLAALEFSRKEAVRSWPALLQRLATARAIERIRERSRNASRFEPLPPGPLVDGKAMEPGQAAATSELAEDLRLALAELDPRQAEVFCLACLEELSYAEIAAQLSVTVNHVGVLLNRARASLREKLEAHAPTASRNLGPRGAK